MRMYSDTERSSALASFARASISSGVTRNFSSSVHFSDMAISIKKMARISLPAKTRRLVRERRGSVGLWMQFAERFRLGKSQILERCLGDTVCAPLANSARSDFAQFGNLRGPSDCINDFVCVGVHGQKYRTLNHAKASKLYKCLFRVLDMNTTTSERVALMISELEIDQTAFGKLAGASKSVVNQWLSGSIKKVGPKYAYNIEQNSGYRKEWVMFGDGESKLLPLSNTQGYSAEAKYAASLISLSDHPDLVSVPRVKFKLSAGVSGYAIEHESGNGKPVFFRKDWFSSNNYKPEKLFAVRVSGASMEPALWDGDLVVINTNDTTPHDGEAFALNYEGELVIKRMRRDAGEWWACSDNSDQRRFSPKRCTEDVVIIGRVIYKQSERI